MSTPSPPPLPHASQGDAETPPAWWASLLQIPERMATEVAAWLPEATLESYCSFLNTMFHYTRDSEARLRVAAERASDPALRAFFLELADDEAPHFRLAERDLAAFGKTPTETPPASVHSFGAAWSRAGAGSGVGHLGALFALESVATHLATEARAALGRLGLGPNNAAFVSVHLHADEAHGRDCAAHCRRAGETQSTALVQAAQIAATAWVDMHRCLVPGAPQSR